MFPVTWPFRHSVFVPVLAGELARFRISNSLFPVSDVFEILDIFFFRGIVPEVSKFYLLTVVPRSYVCVLHFEPCVFVFVRICFRLLYAVYMK